MAAAVRLAREDAPPMIGAVAADAFGEAFGAQLAATVQVGKVISYRTTELHAAARAQLATIAAAHPMAHICERLDKLCARSGTAWLSVVQQEGGLTVGPLVVPGRGPCYHCFLRRTAQHAVDADIVRCVTTFYREHPGAGPTGVYPPLSGFAAAVVADLAGRLADNEADDAGIVLRFDLFDWRAKKTRVLGVDGCPRCSGQPPHPDRTIAAFAGLFDGGVVR